MTLLSLQGPSAVPVEPHQFPSQASSGSPSSQNVDHTHREFGLGRRQVEAASQTSPLAACSLVSSGPSAEQTGKQCHHSCLQQRILLLHCMEFGNITVVREVPQTILARKPRFYREWVCSGENSSAYFDSIDTDFLKICVCMFLTNVEESQYLFLSIPPSQKRPLSGFVSGVCSVVPLAFAFPLVFMKETSSHGRVQNDISLFVLEREASAVDSNDSL